MNGLDQKMTEDNEETNGIVEAPPLGAPVLSIASEFTKEELRIRIENNVPVTSAEEYLARVDLEARTFPEIVSAIQQQPQPQAENDHPSSTNELIQPTKRQRQEKKNKKPTSVAKQWSLPQRIPPLVLDQPKREALRQSFARVRQEMLELEERFQADESKRANLLQVNFPTSLERIQWMEFIAGQAPLLHVLVQMDNVSVVRGVRHITKAFELDSNMSHARASWLFALLAKMEIPFTDDVGSMLRRLMRLIVQQDVAAADKEDDEQELNPRTLIRCILEDFFGQADGDES